MSSPDLPPDRLRQIAILISIVDGATAQKLLMHLPTSVAKAVHSAATQMGPVSAEEKQKILAAFQKSGSLTSETGSPVKDRAAGMSPAQSNAMMGKAQTPGHGDISHSELNLSESYHNKANDESESEEDDLGEWSRLELDALKRFVDGERSIVIAVVVSQLPAKKAAALLGELGPTLSYDVVRQLSRLQQIDPAAKAEIEAHLDERLGEQRHLIRSELENTRRLRALMREAPSELRQHWQAALDGKPWNETTPTNVEVDQPSLPTQRKHPSEQPHPTLHELYQAPSISTVSLTPPITDGANHGPADQLDTSKESPAPTSEPNVVPFPVSDPETSSTVDRSLGQIEFERILDLPPQLLATLLSSLDSQTVLLALAGATPEFMTRFRAMLDRHDARELDTQLKGIGAMNFRDIDEAQRRIAERAVELRSQHPSRTVHRAA